MTEQFKNCFDAKVVELYSKKDRSSSHITKDASLGGVEWNWSKTHVAVVNLAVAIITVVNVKSGKLCNSKCHQSLSCENK